MSCNLLWRVDKLRGLDEAAAFSHDLYEATCSNKSSTAFSLTSGLNVEILSRSRSFEGLNFF